MNCKPGDLAIFVKSSAGNVGAIVEVIRPLGYSPVFDGATWSDGRFCWLVRSIGAPLKSRLGPVYVESPAPDDYLRPIRDTDGEDEMLRIVGKPVGEAVSE